MNSMLFTMRPLDRITPYEQNPRVHPEEQIAAIIRSIQEFGWTKPIEVDKNGNILAGHGRYLAARRMGLEEAPVRVHDHLSPEQARAYRIADNQVALGAVWDEGKLQAELEALQLDEVDLALTGFDQAELDRILDETDFDPVEPEEQPSLSETKKARCPDCGCEFVP